ncbi:MAG: hypothetical protein K6B41_05475 [Butyrivibrio sp.]|nr:hypothetical protein [Butyrivibrio sp.]
MNQNLYDAVFGCGANKVDPFDQTNVEFDKIIADMRAVGYEITSLNIAEYIVIQELDLLNKKKNQIIESAQDLDERDEFCRSEYGSSFKDIVALDPKTDFEWDLKSGKVHIYLVADAAYKADVYVKVFKWALDDFNKKTGFDYKL